MLTLRQLLSAISPGDWFTTINQDAYFHIAIYVTRQRCDEEALLWQTDVRILAYLDNWALVANSEEQAAAQLSQMLMHIQALGFSVNLQKSSMIPSQQFSFLGLEICSPLSYSWQA